jgi:dienelactone hydrolase
MEPLAARQALLTRLGSFPERAPLAQSRSLTTAAEGYTRTLVTYRVEAGEAVSAWLLMPQGVPPADGWPAVLAIHQHANAYHLGKAEPAGLAGDPMYAYGLELCRRGCAVLCPDLLCFEDRRRTPAERQADRPAADAGYERFEFTKRLLAGSCLQAKYLHDLSCAVDVLTAQPSINRERLGVIGHSLGGLEALWLTWYDPRISAARSLRAASACCAPWCVMASIMVSPCMFLACWKSATWMSS